MKLQRWNLKKEKTIYLPQDLNKELIPASLTSHHFSYFVAFSF